MELKTQQEQFLKSLFLNGNSSEMLQSIRHQKGIDNSHRLKVYQRSYRNRIINVLKKDYSLFTQLMGDKKVRDIFSNYLDKYPSREFSLSEIGRSFPEYIQKTQSDYPEIIPDLVQLEWLLHSSFYREYDPLQQTTAYPIVLIDEESNTHFSLHPSVQTQWSHWPIVKIYQDKELDKKKLLPLPTGAVVWSIQGHLKLKNVDKFTFQLIEGMKKSTDLNTIVNAVNIPDESLATSLEKSFAELISNEILQVKTLSS